MQRDLGGIEVHFFNYGLERESSQAPTPYFSNNEESMQFRISLSVNGFLPLKCLGIIPL